MYDHLMQAFEVNVWCSCSIKTYLRFGMPFAGSTEVAADCTCYEVQRGSTGNSPVPSISTYATKHASSIGSTAPGSHMVPAGRPLAGIQVIILPPAGAEQEAHAGQEQAGQPQTRQAQASQGFVDPLPAGQVGEVCVAGPGLAAGYLHNPELTHTRFVNLELGGATSSGPQTPSLPRFSALHDAGSHSLHNPQPVLTSSSREASTPAEISGPGSGSGSLITVGSGVSVLLGPGLGEPLVTARYFRTGDLGYISQQGGINESFDLVLWCLVALLT